MTDWRDLPALEPADVPDRPERLSQTFLRTFQRCHRSGMLYARYGGGAPSHELVRGSLYHEWAATWALELVAAREQRMPPELGKSMMQDLIGAHPEFTLPSGEQDALRLMAWNTAEHESLDPGAVLAVEKKLTVSVGGEDVSGTIDLAVGLNPLAVLVRDYKTTLAMPTQEDFELGFQLPLYALLLADGRDEAGMRLGDGVRYFQLEEVYPRYALDDAGLFRRSVVLDRERVLDKRVEVEQLVAAVNEAWSSRKFSATPGTWCGECAAREECPLPRELRPHSKIQSADEAEVAAAWLVRMIGYNDQGSGGVAKLIRDGLRRWCSDNGPVWSGNVRFGFEEEVRREVDNEGMAAQALRAAQFGEPFDPLDFVKERPGTRFRRRKVVNDEEEEAA